MDVSEYMKKHGLDDASLDAMAEPYERGDYESGGGEVYAGSQIDAVGKRRVTVIYDASATKRAEAIARRRGVRPSEIYRDALDYYLAAQS